MITPADLEQTKAIIKKIFWKFDSEPELILTYFDKGELNLTNFANAAFNHLFDDYYQKFDITEYEGHVVRAYFHNQKNDLWEKDLQEFFKKETNENKN